MKIEKYPSHCSKCGAPLTRKRGDIICDYCGQVYFLSERPDGNREQEETTKPDIDISKNNFASEASQPETETKQYKPDKTKTNRKVKPWLIGIFVLIMLGCFSACFMMFLLNVSGEKIITHNEETLEARSLIQKIYQEKYESVQLPAASNEELPVSTAVIIEHASTNRIFFSLFFHNQSGADIDTSSFEKHLEITDIAVTSNLEDKFTCSLKKENWKEDIFAADEIRKKGTATCTGSLSPQTSSMIIDFDMPNWGSSHLSISIPSNDETLEPNIDLLLDSDHYNIDIGFQTEAPQFVWVNKSDITIRDDMGNSLSLDECTLTSEEGKGEYFLIMASPQGRYNLFYLDDLVHCRYDGKFPSEINTMEVRLKTTAGNTFTSHAVINKTDGMISFTNETVE